MTDIGESISVDIIKEDPEKKFNAKVTAVNFTDGLKAAHNKSAISGDHWPAPKYKGKYSQKAAVYVFGSSAAQKVDVTIEIDSEGYSGNGKLTGIGGGLEFEGSIPLSSGTHKVTVKIKTPPDALFWFADNVSWGIDTGDASVMAGNTFVELFFVHKDPTKIDFFKSGVWTEVLRFAFINSLISSNKDEKQSLEDLTRMCFEIPNHRYEIERGAAKFVAGRFTKYKITKYMDGSTSDLNCYDQACAVMIFSGALGLKTDVIYIQPFGFLAAAQLVGRGRSNNPFPRAYYTEAVKTRPTAKLEDFLFVAPDAIGRRGFGNHMFCEFTTKIFDACAGPVLGTVDRAGYAATAIDNSASARKLSDTYRARPELRYFIRAGTVAEMDEVPLHGINLV